MRIEDTSLSGVKLITPQRFHDDRGYFSSTWVVNALAEAGLATPMVQRNVSFNIHQHTLRGMHFQRDPHAEVKLVSCLTGAIYDVAIDLRPDSPTFCTWVGAELSADNGCMLYIPTGFAHGYLTLAPNTLVEYLVSAYYVPQAGGGVRWNDPAFNIQWTNAPARINERDQTYPDFVASPSTPLGLNA
ncbi:MAG: dTDP-4-dehydrorhamnose 3,5-epimerase [Chloroflexota bacterium]